MPRGITGLGSRGHQAALHGPPAVWRNDRGGHDCGPPVCGQLQLGAGCRCSGLGMLHSVRPHSCGAVTAAARDVAPCRSYGASVRLQPCGRSGQRRCARRGGIIPVSCTQGKGSMFPSWQHACLSRDAVLRPRSVGWQMVVRLHVNKWTSSGRHAVRVAQARRETRRGGRQSALPVPGRLTAQSPCRLGWRRGPLLTPLKASNRHAAHGVGSGHPQWALQSQSDEWCSQSEQRGQLPMEGCRGSQRACWGRPVDTRGGRWSPGSWCQQRQALARQGVAHQEYHVTGTPTAGLVEATAANEPRRQEHSCIALCKYLCVCCRSGKKEEHREAHQHSERHSWMATIHAVRSRHQQSRTAQEIHTKAKK
ncbi:hypothetical protein ECC02_010560 [Trypanosoma cruzi]|uniref:Uncharacterized protein n=1 Tax=Trypanosoma cruzi TaxID=5693 RepID=A0A7J6XQ75_TRYCR|nr:hypothetical protein ECC02_010560 [Trypanosoma cruzi]